MMTATANARSRLLLGSGAAALALSLSLSAPDQARARGINASPNVVQGSATIDPEVPGLTTITATRGLDPVIDWTPFLDQQGNALIFLPDGNTALFQNELDAGEFTVINRILPSPNNDIVRIDGTVISRLQTADGPVPGGFVIFYSPTGILVGSTALFDIGKLMLTTLDVRGIDPTTQTINLVGAMGGTARIETLQGAQFLAPAENSLVAFVGHQVIHRGTINVNGTAAFVAGEEVNITFNNGLLDITVPVGTEVAQAILHDGTTGGPSSNGAGDNHMIYGVARAKTNPISFLFRGNLGFAPAQNAGVVNGEIILSANYDVTGRTVAGGSISDGILAQFAGIGPASQVAANLFMGSVNATSSLLAIGSNLVRLDGSSVFDGNLMMVGRERVELHANGQDPVNMTISGDLLVSADNYGQQVVSANDPDSINAVGGQASVFVGNGGSLMVGGDARVSAVAFGGADIAGLIAGTAQGGMAEIEVFDNGALDITGGATVRADAEGVQGLDLIAAAEARGGHALFRSHGGSTANIGQNLLVATNAITTQTDQTPNSFGANAFGGLSRIEMFEGGSIDIGGNIDIFAAATSSATNQAGQSGFANGGDARIIVDGGQTLSVGGDVNMEVRGASSINRGGQGGNAFGGAARLQVLNGNADIGGLLRINATGLAGSGTSGGDGFGGIAGAEVDIGSLDITGFAHLDSEGSGGNASFGFGGSGGDGEGGRSLIEARGTLTDVANISIGGTATVLAEGRGGDGGSGDGVQVAPNVGGNGTGGSTNTVNQADQAFTNGATILAHGDNGTVTIGGITRLSTDGEGGRGGMAGAGQLGATGGVGQGGSSRIGLIRGTGDGSVGAGRMALGEVGMDASGLGGSGGLDPVTTRPTGDGGQGIGGSGIVTLEVGSLAAGILGVDVRGQGGFGANGGTGTGGGTRLSGFSGGSATLTLLDLDASANGGGAENGDGGSAIGGTAFIDVDGIDLTVTSRTNVQAEATGRSGNGGKGGDALGGTAQIGSFTTDPGSGAFGGVTSISANARGGDAQGSFDGGRAEGGEAIVQASGGSSLHIALARMLANGFGGNANQSGNGGDAFGGATNVRIDDGSPFVGRIAADANALGGNSTDGAGGQAIGGTSKMLVDNATAQLNGLNQLVAFAIGGTGGTQGGDALGGTSQISIINGGAVDIATGISGVAIMQLRSFATGGDGQQVGNANGGIATLDMLDGTLSADELIMEADATSQGTATGSIAGTARGGSAFALIEGNSTLDLTSQLAMSANAAGGPGGSTTGGMVGLELRPASPQVNVDTLAIAADGFGGDSNGAGHFAIAVRSGALAVNSFTATALGDSVPAQQTPSTLIADGGNIAVTGPMIVDVFDDLNLRTGQGGLIGGPLRADPSAEITLTSQGRVLFEGDDDNTIGFGGLSLTINSREVDIEAGARIAAVDMVFNSLDTANAAILGGANEEPGFTLTQDEASRIDAGNFTFNGPAIDSQDPHQPDIIMRDITVFGSLDDGVSAITINADPAGGILRVEGSVEYLESAETDLFALTAGNRIEIVTPGGIRVSAPGGAPGGVLTLDAPNIWAADADMIDRLQADPVFAGRDGELAVAGPGSDDPGGYLVARTMELYAGDTLLVRNTGSATEQGGITVGDGGLTIFANQADGLLDAFAYGRRVDANGNAITGADFFAEVDFGLNEQGSAGYLDASRFNDCIINTGECPSIEPEQPENPIEGEVALTNPATTVDPVRTAIPPGSTLAESNAAFGVDFPGLVEAPLLGDTPLIEDPVASGGDTTLYGGNSEDEEDEEENEEGEEEGEGDDE